MMIASLLLALALQDVSFEERKLGERPEGSSRADSWFSPDGRGVAWLELKDDRWFVQLGDRRLEDDYDEMSTLLWRPDGKVLAHAGRTGKTWRVVAGGEKGEPYGDVRELAFSPDSKVFAYEARQGKVHRMVVNGKPGEPYESVGAIEFGPEGRFAYAGQKGDDWFLVSNERTVGPFSDIDSYKFHGRMLCSLTRKKDQRFITVGDKQSGPFDEIGAYHVSADGGRVILGVREKGLGYLVTDGVKSEPILSHVNEIVLGPDGKTVAYHAGDRKSSRLFMGDWRSPEIPSFGLGYLTIAPDGKRVVCQVVREDEQRVWDGELGEPFEQIRQLRFSAKGELCYRGTKDSRDYLVIGRRRAFECATLWKYLFTPSGVLVIAADVETGKGVIRVGDKTHGPYDASCDAVHLSPDGKKVAFGATAGRELWWKVVPVD
jgi:WD40 repeat protein